ncbi:nucleoside triphosphate pyrophosphohydrolase [Acidomonas methanolica]|uniref:Nucleotide pyrophosphohydrolase MazG n=1 Tax=Acidomonas methanolica NBRC 104435 TaxID=1231351 RepID=A0A023D5W5_ACIMT|nr:nucleoside triphosphate pyrophosphohydrolase [Acidomonas methanolica]MBU2655212.1 nucleoside triphosphate pyrophosphohydrolase [Acidomonas methanolica]TCS25618.1 ATP diphosphatase [Acidomonas methanolica]GAJ29542.1 nucleotide pyrophosphohydrolase MazG [Acidomonas methanolica NBRC 104435]GBQ51383.1 nucleotide pyrophosphohydrolase MazG [Acidomonas methanolica]GEK98742.1 nucleoside triphosphate pyrophosphohydrolase [Acidomonas methanolica NBRC 104435]
MSAAEQEIGRLLAIMARLRDPENGCPWDRVQTHATIAPYAIEEAYEVMDAVNREDWSALPGELGDLLLQVVYQARIAEEENRFDFAAVARAIADKMVHRHPHVFGGAASAPGAWEAAKAAERAEKAEHGILGGIAGGLPALLHAAKLGARAARAGFDWDEPEGVLEKIEEEIGEVRAELPEGDRDRLEDEIGDVLFTVATLARKLDLDPEACLRRANAKFTRRFNDMEAILAARGEALQEQDLSTLESLWTEVKRRHRLADHT